MLLSNILGKSAIDIIVNLGDLVGGVNSDGGRFTLFNLGKARHGV